MDRREFLTKGTAFLGIAGNDKRLLSYEGDSGQFENTSAQLEPLTEHVSLYRDIVNVGVIRSNGKTLLIDSGEAWVLNHAKELKLGAIDSVLYTHYHRDQCTGAGQLKEAGVKIAVPASEAQFFNHATEFWQEANSILNDRMNFRPEIMVLRESVATDHDLNPGETLHWEGITIRVLATPGHTDGSLTYLVEADGKTIAFSGDLIAGPGQVWEFYSLQKAFPGMVADYWGFGGASAQLMESAHMLVTQQPGLLVPSHGRVIEDPKAAVDLLQTQLDAMMANYFSLTAWRIYARWGLSIFSKGDTAPPVPMLPPLPSAKLPPWLLKVAQTTFCIIAEDKSAFIFDCGFFPISETLAEWVSTGDISRVDGIWISHYHDDHTTSANKVRQRYGSKVYVQREMQDILENPMAYCMPALFTEGIHVDHALSEGEVIEWKGYKMTAFYFPGQTLYHDGLLVERDGVKVFMTGDSFANWGIDDYCSYNRNFVGTDGNLAGYKRCVRLMMKVKPDLLCAAHWGPLPVSQEYLQKTLDLIEERDGLLTPLFPWDDANFGLDPYWISAYPYRQSVLPGQRVSLEARIYNHSDVPHTTSAELRTPVGWQVKQSQPVTIPPHTEGKIPLTAVAPRNPPIRRQVLGLAVHFDQHRLGEFAEAIVDFLIKRT